MRSVLLTVGWRHLFLLDGSDDWDASRLDDSDGWDAQGERRAYEAFQDELLEAEWDARIRDAVRRRNDCACRSRASDDMKSRDFDFHAPDDSTCLLYSLHRPWDNQNSSTLYDSAQTRGNTTLRAPISPDGKK